MEWGFALNGVDHKTLGSSSFYFRFKLYGSTFSDVITDSQHMELHILPRIGLACSIIDWAGPTPYDDMRLGFASQTAGVELQQKDSDRKNLVDPFWDE